ncbi:MAG: methyltransferase domain-containing protein [Cyclobacteriaceae bacterium]
MIKIQYGCGLFAPENWLNYDSSVTLKLQKLPFVGALVPSGPFGRFPKNVLVGDIIKGLPLKENTVDLVYCSHVLEHLPLADFRKALKNTFKVLKPGGTFRLVLPDLEAKAKAYLDNQDPDSSLIFMDETYLGKEQRPKNLKGFLHEFYRNDRHFWMWDYKSMKKELEDAGFVDVRRAEFNDSAIPDFKEVEELRRWENELGVECRRP